MNSIVLTGATGTIGLAVIDECIKNNIKVLAIVNPGSEKIQRIPKADNISIVECAMKDYSSLDISGDYEVFIHLAWASTDGDGARNMVMPQIKNIEYAIDAVALAKRLGCNVFVGAGSQAEYGRKNEDLTENTETNPESAYGIAKLCCGDMTRILCNQYGIRHIWTRILSTYGPNSNYKTVINYTLFELLMGRRPSLSAGTQIWDFIYVYDAARALLKLAQSGHNGETYVIGSGNNDYLYNYLQLARECVAKVVNVDVPKLSLGDVPYNDRTVMHLSCNIDKLIADTGYCPDTSFKEGIDRTIEWIIKDKGLKV